MLATFVGCAGVGKNTVIQEIIKNHPDEYENFPTITTRPKRTGESEGNPYIFKSVKEFEELLDAGEIYEWQIVHNDQYYGGSRTVLREHLASGKTLVKDIDVLGAKTYKEKLSEMTKILSVFLYVDSFDILIERMRGRGDEPDDIEARAGRFKMEMAESVDCDYMVNNIDVAASAAATECLLRAEAQGEPHYRCAAGCTADEDEIAEQIARIRNGERLEGVFLTYNGKELLITEGAARYEAAKRENAFIQKIIGTLPDYNLENA